MNHHSATQKTISFQLILRRVSRQKETPFWSAVAGVGEVLIGVRRRSRFNIGLATIPVLTGGWQWLYLAHSADFSRLVQADFFRECNGLLRLEDIICHNMTVKYM
jgi:hypothetical protein